MKTFVRGLIGKEDLNIGSGTFSRTTSSGGSQTMTQINANSPNIVFADQMAGTDASAKIQAAIAVLSALGRGGGIVDARNLTDVGGTGSQAIDANLQAITLLLGPTTYNFSQVILESNFKILGMGIGANGAAIPTIIQSTDTTKDLFILTTVNQPIESAHLEGFRIKTKSTGSGTSQCGINLKATATGGLWYSTMINLQIGATAPGEDHFHGGNFILDATVSGGCHQFNDFTKVVSNRSANSTSGHSLDIWGNCGQHIFRDCEFDGNALNDGGTNVFIGDKVNLGQTLMPNTLTFIDCTCQKASKGWDVEGSWACSWFGTHIENCGKVWTFSPGAINNNISATIQGSYVATSGGTGVSGYILTDSSTAGNASINFIFNMIEQAPDNYITGTTANINQAGNVGIGAGSNNPIASVLRGSYEFTGTVKADTGFSQSVTVAVATTPTFTNVGVTSACAMFLVRDDNHGGNALIAIGDSGTVVVVASWGSPTTFVVTGSPTSTQIRLQVTSSQLQASCGSGAGPSINFTQISAA